MSFWQIGLVEVLVLWLRHLLKRGSIIVDFTQPLFPSPICYGTAYSFCCIPILTSSFSCTHSKVFVFPHLNILYSFVLGSKQEWHMLKENMWLLGCLLYKRILVYLCSKTNWLHIANFGGKQYSTKYSLKGRCESFLLLKIVSPLLSASIVDFASWISITIELWWNF